MDWKKIVTNIAPAIGTALGGPMAGMATKFIADTVMGNSGATAEDVGAYIAGAGPADLMKLKQADQDFKVKMRELDIDLERINQADRGSAREMMTKTTPWPQIILSVVYTVAYAMVLWAYITGNVEVAQGAQAQFSIVLGVLTAAQAQILNFWFGSSSGSKEKTQAMAAQH